MSKHNSYQEKQTKFNDYVVQQTAYIESKYAQSAKKKINQMKKTAFKSVNPNEVLSLGHGESYHYSCEEKTDLSVIGNMVQGIVDVFTGKKSSINNDSSKVIGDKDAQEKTNNQLESITNTTSMLSKSQATYLLVAGQMITEILQALTYEESNTFTYEARTQSVGIGLRMFCYAVSAKNNTSKFLNSSSVYNYYFSYELCFNMVLAKQEAQVEHILELENQVEAFNTTMTNMIIALGKQIINVPLDNIALSEQLTARLGCLKMMQEQYNAAYKELQDMKVVCNTCNAATV
ncbi:hypothetical protein A6E13_11175 [Aliivibrio fischeri]|uniref:hypothetical protein n=1 Tax=Aliivibrio fischeri TaxID=668 RepID=UPI00080E8D38|nr:hypothetical protein [Aliivibrio fischeri]OCH32968.1 hypothetical protein A6E13_11175 [Aliivibrio fischeri]